MNKYYLILPVLLSVIFPILDTFKHSWCNVVYFSISVISALYIITMQNKNREADLDQFITEQEARIKGMEADLQLMKNKVDSLALGKTLTNNKRY